MPAGPASYQAPPRIIHDFTQALQSAPAEQILGRVAEALRLALNAAAVVVVMKAAGKLSARAWSVESSEAEEALHPRAVSQAHDFEPLARQAFQSGSALLSSFDPPGDSGSSANPLHGAVMACGLGSQEVEGALLVYGGRRQPYGGAQRMLLSALAGVASLAISRAHVQSHAQSQAGELQQILEISAELGTASDLDQFLERFVVRSAEFIGFERSYIALVEGDHTTVHWRAENGKGSAFRQVFDTEITRRVIATGQPFFTEDVTQLEAPDWDLVHSYSIRQYLVVPIVGSGARVLGVLGLLDRKGGAPITAEELRRARALAAEVAVALEAAQNLHLSEGHRRQSEALVSMAMELGSSLSLPDFVRSFSTRAADIMEAAGAALLLAQGGRLETVHLHGTALIADKVLQRRFKQAATDLAAREPGTLFSAQATSVLPESLAAGLGWGNVTVARLTGTNQDLLGLLWLVDAPTPMSTARQNLLQALVAHASVTLENSRLFSRIAQSNKQWAEIFDSITDFIVVHDDANRVLRVNRSMADFIGVRPAELIGVTMRALLAITSQQPSGPCPFCRPENHEDYLHPILDRTYLVSSSQVNSAFNEGMQTVHVLKDITDRREAERRYRELFDNVQEGVFFSSPEGRFIEVNDALVRMLGYGAREEVLQLDIPTQVYTAPEERQKLLARLDEANVLHNTEVVLRRKDGSLIHAIENSFAVRGAQGEVLQYRGVLLDVTDTKFFQAQLQRERDFNSKILNNTQSLILVADGDGSVTYANRRCFESLQYRQEELIGRPLRELVAPLHEPDVMQALDATIRGQQVDNLEMLIRRQDESLARFSVNLSPMRDEQGHVSSLVVVMTDITDAAMLQAKLMHTEKMAAVGQLVSGVAHEVNNPLTAILGFADLLLESPELPASSRGDLTVILQEAQRTKEIVQNLLSFARQMPPQRRMVQLNTILQRTLALRSYDFSSHGVEVVCRLDGDMPEVMADAHQLQQVFLNIINNAYDAVQDSGLPGHIEVWTRTDGKFVDVLFADNGPGVVHAERIFDPFFTTKEVGKGTGLGLSICYGIVREHGGEIGCRNLDEGGAVFTVRLPVAGEHAAAAAAGGAR